MKSWISAQIRSRAWQNPDASQARTARWSLDDGSKKALPNPTRLSHADGCSIPEEKTVRVSPCSSVPSQTKHLTAFKNTRFSGLMRSLWPKEILSGTCSNDSWDLDEFCFGTSTCRAVFALEELIRAVGTTSVKIGTASVDCRVNIKVNVLLDKGIYLVSECRLALVKLSEIVGYQALGSNHGQSRSKACVGIWARASNPNRIS